MGRDGRHITGWALAGIMVMLLCGASSAQGFVFSESYKFNPANGHVYRLTPGVTTWTACQSYAVNHQIGTAYVPGNLATVRSADENAWLVATFDLAGSSKWIGFNDFAVEGTWEWVSGEGSAYTNWNTGEPNDASGEDCCQITGTGLWNDLSAARTLAGIVEIVPAGGGAFPDGNSNGVPDAFEDNNADGTPDGFAGTPAPAFNFLADGYRFNPANGHVYWMTPWTQTWDESRLDAQTHTIHGLPLPGDLVTIRSIEEDLWLRQTFAGECFIGYSADPAWPCGAPAADPECWKAWWTWSSGETATYSHWADGEPNNYGTNGETVAVLRTTGLWNDMNAVSTLRTAIVEFVPPCPGAYSDPDGDGVPAGFEDADQDGLPDGLPLDCANYTDLGILECDNTVGGIVYPGRNICLVVPNPVAPDSYFVWERDGVELENDLRLTGVDTRILSINNVEPADSGEYVCYYDNGSGVKAPAVFGPIRLTVPASVPVAGFPALAGLVLAGIAGAVACGRRRRT